MRRTRFALVAFLAAFMAALMSASLAAAQDPVAGDFQKVTLDDNTQNPMELDVAPDGRVFYIERDGRLQIWKPDTQQTVDRGHDPGHAAARRTACSASQLAPDFDTSQLGLPLLLAAARTARARRSSRASRSTATRSTWLRAEDPHLPAPDRAVLPLLRLAVLRPRRQPLHLDGRQHEPVRLRRLRPDRRAPRPRVLGRAAHGGQHERPQRQDPAHQAAGDPDRHARRRHDVHDPGRQPLRRAGHEHKTRPEIFGMGFRNPFRFTVDPKTGWVLMGDYGPDASTTNANRGPQGSVEYNVAHEGRQLRLAVLHPRQRRLQRLRLRDRDLGRQVQLRRAGQQLAQQHRPDQPAAGRSAPSAWMGYTETDPRFTPDLGTGGAPMGGPRYHYDPTSSRTASSRRSTTTSGSSASGTTAGSRPPTSTPTRRDDRVSDAFALGTGYKRPMDIDFGPDGALYVIEWGSGFNGNNADSGVYRIDYIAGDKAPIAQATGDADHRPRAARRSSSRAPARTTPRAPRSPTRGTSTATARPTRPTRTRRTPTRPTAPTRPS